MKFTINWLKRYLDTDATLGQICDTLTAIGLEVEGIEDKAKDLAPFKVALIETAEKHPDADRLKVCTVKANDGTHNVVCGAPNARAGMKGIFAPEGTYIAGLDVTLKKTKIRGVESNGMMVSEREMQLSEEHDGIIEVDGKWDIGTPMAEIYGLNDPIVEINVTPNRADCAGIYGIARDLAAAGLGTLKPLDVNIHNGTFSSDITLTLNDDGCPHFIGREIKNIKNEASPAWFQTLLTGVGLRPISALVDITNFMTVGFARPLHVYDTKKLSGNIAVRTTSGGEKFDALNDKTYTAEKGAIGIYDDSGLIGLGGIIGGVSTSCDENTTSVFIESAYFEPMRIARSGRDMSIISDARYRFERGVDPAFTARGIDLATALILEFCSTDNTHVSEITQAGTTPDHSRTYPHDPAYVEQLIGVSVQEQRQIEILESLGFLCVQGDKNTYTVTPPSWRGDILGRADLVEEIIRIYGFEHIPAVSIATGHAQISAPETLMQARGRKARSALINNGYAEAVTWSFMNNARAQMFGANDNPALVLSNAISAQMDTMRPSIIPNLMDAAARSSDKGFADIALFEIGPVFQSSKPDGQQIHGAGIRSGQYTPRHHASDLNPRDVDTFDVKADVLAALSALGAPTSAQITRDAPSYYHPGRSGAMRLGKNVLAYFGELHPAILDDMGIKTPMVGFEIILDNIPAPRGKVATQKKHLNSPPLQAVTRDFSFVVANTVDGDALLRVVKAADKSLITDAEIFDVYSGKGVEDGHKSIALSVTIQPADQTLKDKDLEDLSNKITTLVEKKTGGILRG